MIEKASPSLRLTWQLLGYDYYFLRADGARLKNVLAHTASQDMLVVATRCELPKTSIKADNAHEQEAPLSLIQLSQSLNTQDSASSKTLIEDVKEEVEIISDIEPYQFENVQVWDGQTFTLIHFNDGDKPFYCFLPTLWAENGCFYLFKNERTLWQNALRELKRETLYHAFSCLPETFATGARMKDAYIFKKLAMPLQSSVFLIGNKAWQNRLATQFLSDCRCVAITHPALAMIHWQSKKQLWKDLLNIDGVYE